MKEILFRGKRKDNGEWVEGGFYKLESLIIGSVYHIVDNKGVIYIVDPSTVGQYTGLTDKNGTKIFGGDIVKRESMELGGIDFIGVVLFREGTYLLDNGEDCIKLFTEIDTLEVLGNIHDNKDLIK